MTRSAEVFLSAIRVGICLAWCGFMLPGSWANDLQSVTSEQHRFNVRSVAGPFEHPWSLAFLPDGRKLVTERPGRLRLIHADGRLDPQPITGMPPIAAIGQGGLLDVALHPDYARNGCPLLCA